MATITIRLSNEEKELIKTYADFEGVSLSYFIKEAVIEKIEDENDFRIAEERSNEYKANKEETTSIKDLIKELNL